jgi:Icc-related predicted phosphoesterase
MRLFVLGDSHEDHASLERAVTYIGAQSPDLLVHLGDFSMQPYTQKMADDLNRTGDMASFLQAKRAHNEGHIRADQRLIEDSGIPYLVVPGNYDPNLITLFGSNDLHNRSTVIGDIMVAGYGGWMRQPPHIETLVQLGEIVPYSERELFETVVATEPDVLLMHGPAHGMNDRVADGTRVGSRAAAQAVAAVKPYLVLSGHVHEARGSVVDRHETGGFTVAVNPGNVGAVPPEPHIRTFAGITTDEIGRPMNVTWYQLVGTDVAVRGTQDFSSVWRGSPSPHP